jgi:hypothetical protein
LTRQSQKETERIVLDKYLSTAKISTQSMTIKQGEKPDFLIQLNGKTIGVEITEFHATDQSREFEETWSSLRCWPLFNNGPENLLITLYFRKRILPSRKEFDRFGKEINSLSSGVFSGETEINISQEKHPLSYRYLSKIVVTPTGSPMRLCWIHNFNVAWIGITENEILSIINDKQKSAMLAENVENWLIIFGGDSLARSHGSLDHYSLEQFPELNRSLKGNAFSKVIIMEQCVIEWDREKGWDTFPES